MRDLKNNIQEWRWDVKAHLVLTLGTRMDEINGRLWNYGYQRDFGNDFCDRLQRDIGQGHYYVHDFRYYCQWHLNWGCQKKSMFGRSE